MSLTRVSYSMTSGIPVGGGGSSTAVIVAGQTQTDITNAMATAGNNGTIYFPNGEYDVTNLTQTYSNQTWEFGRNALLKRVGGTDLLTLQAGGLRLYGAQLDANVDLDNGLGVGVNGTTSRHSLEIDDVYLINTGAWGLNLRDEGLKIHRLKTYNLAYAALLYSTANTRTYDIEVSSCDIDQTGPKFKGFGGGGGLLVRVDASVALAGGLLVNPIMRDNFVKLPQITSASQVSGGAIYENCVAIECHNSSGGLISGNSTQFGKIGLSHGSCNALKVIGNTVASPYAYGVEVTKFNGSSGCDSVIVDANWINSVNGFNSGSSNPSQGVQITFSSNTIVTSNVIRQCTQAVGINAGSSGTVSANNITV